MCTFSDVAFVYFCVTIETPKENQGFWLCLGLAGRLVWLAGVAPTVEKPKENQGFRVQPLPKPKENQCLVALTLEKPKENQCFVVLGVLGLSVGGLNVCIFHTLVHGSLTGVF